MAGRGRPRGTPFGTSKMMAPNLAMAGKLEVKVEQNGNAERGRGRGGKRGQRGRGSGRGGRDGHDKKSNIIQSEGIFSEGIGAFEKNSRRTERVNFPQKEEAVRLLKTEAVVGRDERGVDPLQNDIDNYDQFWTVNPDDEDAELRQMFGPGVISDLKKGSIPPIVLPRHDEIQFFDLLPKKVKDEIFSEGEEERREIKQELETDRLRRVTTHQNPSENKDDGIDPTLVFGEKAANIFKRLAAGQGEELILIQLPTILGNLASQVKTEEPVCKQEVGIDTDPSTSEAIGGLEPSNLKEPATLPRGKEIGSLIITRHGRAYFEVNGQRIDVTASSAGTAGEGVIGIEVRNNEESAESGGIFGYSAAQRARMNEEKGQNALYYFGEVKHHMTASVNWEKMRRNAKTADEQKKINDT